MTLREQSRAALRQKLILWIAPYAYRKANPNGKMDTPSIVYEQVEKDLDAELTEPLAVFLDDLIISSHQAFKAQVLASLPPLNEKEHYSENMSDAEKGWDNYGKAVHAAIEAIPTDVC